MLSVHRDTPALKAFTLYTFSLVCGMCLFALPACAAVLTPADTLSCTVTTGASASYVHGSGGKGTQDGLLLGTWNHSFNTRLHTDIGIRGSSNSSRPFIEEAALVLTTAAGDISSGFLNARYGFKSLYRPHSLFNFLFDAPMLWNTYGFGIGYQQKSGQPIQLGAQSSLNSKESAQAHVTAQAAWSHQSAMVIGGIQTYSTENQDNNLLVGGEWQSSWSKLQMHCIGTYADYTGFGHDRNSTMVPGYKGTAFVEMNYTPQRTVTLSGMGYYEQMHKAYEHEFVFCGTEVCWMAFSSLGMGCGMEWQQDDATVSLMPRTFIQWTPLKESADIQVGVQPTIIDNAIPNWRITGELWIRL